MSRPGGHNYQVPRLDILVLAGDRRARHAAREGQGLVDEVHFVADVAADGDGHEDHLAEEAGPEDAPEFARGGGEGGRHRGEVGHLVGRRLEGFFGVLHGERAGGRDVSDADAGGGEGFGKAVNEVPGGCQEQTWGEHWASRISGERTGEEGEVDILGIRDQ